MTEARAPRPDDRPPAGLSAGLLIVAAVIVVHLFFALVIGIGSDDPALADPGATGPSATCVGAEGSTGPTSACATPASPVAPASDAPSEAPEPAVGGRGSY